MCHSKNIKVLSLVTICFVFLCLLFQCRSNINNDLPGSVDVVVDQSWMNALGQDPRVISKQITLDTALYQIIGTAILGLRDKSNWDSGMVSFISDSNRIRTRDSAALAFKHFDWQQSLSAPLARYHSDFPQKEIPKFFMLITDFNYGIFNFQTVDGHDAIGIGTEMFMGKTALYDQLSIANPNFSNYLNRTFNTSHLPSKIMYAIADDAIAAPATNRFLDNLLTQGKKIFLVKKWMPNLSDTILLEYTADQLQWVEENELDIWRFLLADRLMYKVSGKDVANLIQPSPHSQGMPPDAPGRAVNYIGWKIIDAYMRKSKSSDADLAGNQDFDQILKVARYRPD